MSERVTGGAGAPPPDSQTCPACGKTVDLFHARWTPCVRKNNDSRRMKAVSHLNQIVGRDPETGEGITQQFLDDAVEHGSKAETWPRPGGGWDLEPVSLTSVKRRTVAMGLHR